MNALVWVQVLTLGALLAALGWALLAGPLRVSSRAARFFMGFNALVLLAGLVLWPSDLWSFMSPMQRLALGFSLALGGVLSLCSGVQVLHALKPTYVTSPLMWPVLVVLMFGVAWGDVSGASLWMAFFAISLWLVGVTLQQALPSLVAQGGTGVAWWSLAPWVAAGVLWLLGMFDSAWSLWQGFVTKTGVAVENHSALLPVADMAVWVASWGLLNGGVGGLLLLKLVEKINELSTEDELTGALNMRSFMALLNAERDRLRRTPQPQALLVCEIDQYHGLNKQLGFAAGDAALRHVTVALGRGLRKTDRLGRSLNAELLIFLPATDSMGAMLVAERTQAAIKANPLLWNGQSVSLTLSIGVGGRENEDLPSETLMQCCVQAVRRAQREGGGRIRGAQYDVTGPVTEPLIETGSMRYKTS